MKPRDTTKRNLIGENIKIIRKRKNITQEELTARLNVLGVNIDRPMVSRIENQTRELTDFEIKAFADALGVNIGDLFKVE